MTWPRIRLVEACEIIMGQSPPSSSYNRDGKGLPFYQGKKEFGPSYPTPSVWCQSPTKIAEPTDVFISVRAPVGPVNLCRERSAIGRGLAAIRPKPGMLDSRFLFLYLSSIDNSWGAQSGAVFSAIAKTHLQRLLIPLPPLSKQKQIVSKIQRLFAKIEEAERLRESALADTAALMPSALHNIFAIARKERWPRETIAELCEKPQYGYTASAKTEPVGPKFLRITDIQNGQVNWEDVPYCECKNIEKHQLRGGDIVFARTGATVGKSFLIESIPKQTIFASYLIRLRVKKRVLPRYLYAFLQSPDYWRQIAGHQIGAAQPNVNASKLQKIVVPIPSLSKQKEIVADLESLSKKALKLQALQRQTAADFSALRQSVLAKAFRGEL